MHRITMDESYNVLMQIFMPKGTRQYRGKNCVSMRDAHLGKKEREKKKKTIARPPAAWRATNQRNCRDRCQRLRFTETR